MPKYTTIKNGCMPFGIRNWTRVDFDSNLPPERSLAEAETDRDLQKSPQQLLCDVHEGVLPVNDYILRVQAGYRMTRVDYILCYTALLNSQKKIASLNARIALESGKTTRLSLFVAFLSLLVAAYAVFKN